MRKLVFLAFLLIPLFLPRVVLAVESTPALPPFGGIYSTPAVSPLLAYGIRGCDSITPVDEHTNCQNCVSSPQNGNWTIFGCLPSDPNGFAAYLLRFFLGIGGGIAFLATVYGGFYLLTSAGNPERINQGKKIIFYAIAGILVIIFAVFILQFVGIQILGIPEFGQ
jgi:hypothetical protein